MSNISNSQDNTSLIKTLFQIFGSEPLEFVLPKVETFLADPDRHKQRAAGELLGG